MTPEARWVELKVAARVRLTGALRAVPPSVPAAVRRRYDAATGLRRTAWGGVVGVLRHRTLAPVEDFDVTGVVPPTRLVAVDNAIVKLLYWYGESGWEHGGSEWWRRLCAQSRTGVLEAGANVGWYTVRGAQAVRPGVPYVAVEPHPVSADVLRRNLVLNGLSAVDVVEAAVVPGPGGERVALALPDLEAYEAPTGAYLAGLSTAVGDRPARRTVEVPTVGFAELAAEADLVKLDIEGVEADVLAPVVDDLASRRAALVVEVLDDTPRLRALLADLLRDGYGCWVLGAGAPARITAAELGTVTLMDRYGSWDVLVMPVGKAAELGLPRPPARARIGGSP